MKLLDVKARSSRLLSNLLTTFLIVPLLVFGGCGGHTAGTNPGTGKVLVGTLALDESGQPVPNVMLEVSNGETAQTGPDGQAFFEALPLEFISVTYTTTSSSASFELGSFPAGSTVAVQIKILQNEIELTSVQEVKESTDEDPLVDEKDQDKDDAAADTNDTDSADRSDSADDNAAGNQNPGGDSNSNEVAPPSTDDGSTQPPGDEGSEPPPNNDGAGGSDTDFSADPPPGGGGGSGNGMDEWSSDSQVPVPPAPPPGGDGSSDSALNSSADTGGSEVPQDPAPLDPPSEDTVPLY